METSSINYQIVETGSTGNTTIIEKSIMIDCGLPFKKIEKYYKDIKIVLLTHIHSDHFNKATIKKLATLRPTLRFVCGEWLVKELVECEVSKTKIDIIQAEKKYNYGPFKIEPVTAYHDVPNIGYKIYLEKGKMLYITDTSSIEHIEAKDFDLFLIEGNYKTEELKQRKLEKVREGRYSYEDRVSKTHLSQEKALEFFWQNAKESSTLIFMHEHRD